MTRFLSTLAVVALAVAAGVVSYSHIEHLALDNGQALLAARLLPVSVDGAVLVASLVLADYARHGAQGPPLGRILLAAGILVTLAANGISGASTGRSV